MNGLQVLSKDQCKARLCQRTSQTAGLTISCGAVGNVLFYFAMTRLIDVLEIV